MSVIFVSHFLFLLESLLITPDFDFAVEFAVLTLDPVTKQPRAKIYRPAEIDALLLAEGLTKKDEDTEMKSV
jgi:hypothetical protein